VKFVIGALLGFAIGFAGALLLAPDKSRSRAIWGERPPKPGEGPPSDNGRGSVKSTLETIREHVDAAMSEARQASADAEKEMKARYERMAGRNPEPKQTPEAKK
jgi:gas vesicle protein